MGLFSRFKKKDDEPNKKEVQAVGWDAITNACENVYPDQKEPKHYGTIISWDLGGNDPLEGISVYDGGDYWHFVTYGLSEIFEEETVSDAVSGYGMGFTFKLRRDCSVEEEAER